MKSYDDFINDCLAQVTEVFPWDLVEELEQNPELYVLDISEPYEFQKAHIPNSINVPRGILESACEYEYDETIPELANGRDRDIVVICRSGKRSVLAAFTLQTMGFNKVRSLKTGLRGWNDDEYPLEDGQGKAVDPDAAEDYYTTRLRPEQRKPAD